MKTQVGLVVGGMQLGVAKPHQSITQSVMPCLLTLQHTVCSAAAVAPTPRSVTPVTDCW
jgi:hypothetical protein